jgi:hypothetical protein
MSLVSGELLKLVQNGASASDIAEYLDETGYDGQSLILELLAAMKLSEKPIPAPIHVTEQIDTSQIITTVTKNVSTAFEKRFGELDIAIAKLPTEKPINAVMKRLDELAARITALEVKEVPQPVIPEYGDDIAAIEKKVDDLELLMKVILTAPRVPVRDSEGRVVSSRVDLSGLSGVDLKIN